MRASDESGATSVEYGLLVAAILLVIAATMFLLGGGIASMFGDLADWLDGLP